MVSNLKSDTARANGAKSRGPTTPEGKEKSSRKAIKHGLTAGTGNILLDCENPDEFEEIFNNLLGIHEPVTPAEKDLVEEMFAARWRIRRMWTIETNLFNVEILTQESKADSQDPGIHLAMAYRALTDDSRSLALASRYEARLQRLPRPPSPNYQTNPPPRQFLQSRARQRAVRWNHQTNLPARNPIGDAENASNHPDRLNRDAL